MNNNNQDQKRYLNCSDEELFRMKARTPEARMEWLDSAVKFAKAKRVVKKN
jgi:hypothetical protein